MKLLLTGATGFVGRNILLRVLAGYDEVYVPVRNAEKLHAQLARENVGAGVSRLHVLPVEPAGWPAIFPDHAILGAGVLFARNRDEYFSTNVDWTLRVLRALPENCRTIVLSSQSAGGPTPSGKSARTENDADAPITWYGESKQALEKAIITEFPDRPISILRPPMILGARDAATLPLFRMTANPVRIKPGWQTKSYSFIAADDLVDAIFAVLALEIPVREILYVASPDSITDRQLIATAAAASGARGTTLSVPFLLVRLLSAVVDAVPALRAKIPSLTRDRVREIRPDCWVVDGTRFSRITGWQARRGLEESLRAAYDHYIREGSL
jgi:nucleoside-diphosphate-sugar epimerase